MRQLFILESKTVSLSNMLQFFLKLEIMKLQNPPQNSSRFFSIFSVAIFVFAYLFFFYRIHFGVDFFDESYYSALPLRLFLGQKLFVDELYLAQTFSLLTYPFFKLHWYLSHSLEGIIYFMRLMNFCLYLALGGFVFYLTKQKISKPIALLIAATLTLYFPGNMLTLSYNTLGTLFLTLSLFLVFSSAANENRGFLFLSGVMMALASISYITFLAVTALLFGYLFIFHPNKKLSLFYALGVALTFIYPLIFIAQHFTEFKASLSFGKEYLHGPPTVAQAFEVIHKFFPKAVLAVLLMVGVLSRYAKKYSSTLYLSLMGSIPILAGLLSHFAYGGWNTYTFYLSLLSLIAYLEVRENSLSRDLLKWIFIPSIGAGLIAALTSASGFINAQVGMVPASLVALIFLAQAMVKIKDKVTFSLLTTLSLPVFLALCYPLNIWNDSPFKELTHKIQVGPYKGIYTAHEKRTLAEDSYKLMKEEINVGGPLLIYPSFAAGYLVSFVPPAKGVTWYQNSGRTNEILADLYAKQINPESRVIRMKLWYGTPKMKTYYSFDPNDPLTQLLESTHHPVKDTEWFTVFAPNSVAPPTHLMN